MATVVEKNPLQELQEAVGMPAGMQAGPNSMRGGDPNIQLPATATPSKDVEPTLSPLQELQQAQRSVARSYSPKQWARSAGEFLRREARTTVFGSKGGKRFEENRRRIARKQAEESFPGFKIDEGYDKYVDLYKKAKTLAEAGPKLFGTTSSEYTEMLKTIPIEDRELFLGILQETSRDPDLLKDSDVRTGVGVSMRRSIGGFVENMGKSVTRSNRYSPINVTEAGREWADKKAEDYNFITSARSIGSPHPRLSWWHSWRPVPRSSGQPLRTFHHRDGEPLVSPIA